jgi:phosphate transport system permease protein
MLGSLVLAIMVLPIVTSLSREVFQQTPGMNEEAALALGATKWEMIRIAVLPYGKPGVIAAVMLGLGRALGETMAVTFVIGNAHKLSASLLAPGSSIASALANEFTEAVGDLYLSSLIELGLILFLITFVILALSKLLLMRLARFEGQKT